MNNNNHLLYEKKTALVNKADVSKDAFSKFFDSKLKEYNEKYGTSRKTKDIAAELGISHDLFRKYINKEKVTDKRDLIIAICAILKLDTTDTNIGLNAYNMTELDDYNIRDEIIMNILDNTEDNSAPIDEINSELESKYYPKLNIHTHRNISKTVDPFFPYTLLEQSVECRTGDLYGSQYDSLNTQYDLRYIIIAKALISDAECKKILLCADSDNHFSLIDYSGNNHPILHCDDINSTGEFKNCFAKLKSEVKSEEKRIIDLFYDTRNFNKRKSARIINNQLHVFFETYNYSMPVLGEYFFMDYVNGSYTLYVSKRSMFMDMYLGKKGYKILQTNKTERFASIDEIDKFIRLALPSKQELLKMRIKAYENAKLEIDALIDELLSGEVFIQNIDAIFENPYDVLIFYQVADAYQCIVDPITNSVTAIGNETATFQLRDHSEIIISIDDLKKGFTLGLNTIDEIESALQQYGDLEISSFLNED